LLGEGVLGSESGEEGASFFTPVSTANDEDGSSVEGGLGCLSSIVGGFDVSMTGDELLVESKIFVSFL
jgi:hypothetical protein